MTDSPTAEPRSQTAPPREFQNLRTDLSRSVAKLRVMWMRGEVGDDELQAVIELAAMLRGLADGSTSGASVLERVSVDDRLQ